MREPDDASEIFVLVHWRWYGVVRVAQRLRQVVLDGGRCQSPTLTAWAVVLLALLASAPLAATSCRQFEHSELPSIGGTDGAWLSSSRLALTDFGQHLFLVYDLDDNTVRGIDPSAEGPDPLHVLDLTSARDGFVMAGINRDDARYSEGLFLLKLGPNLKPVTTYAWPQDWGEDIHFHDGLGRPLIADEVVGTQDGLVSWFDFANPERDGIMQFALPTDDGDPGLTPTGSWPELPAEAHPRVPLLPSRLAATTGEDAFAYALRVDDKPFIQRLVGDGERLGVFPEWPGPLPSLPPVTSVAHYDAWWAAVERASFPGGLYAEGPLLYLLMRLAATGGPEWDLHAIDPVAESLVHSVRLPTRAAHIALVPGPRHWALIEGSSRSEDRQGKPKSLLLLDSESIRSGGKLSCN